MDKPSKWIFSERGLPCTHPRPAPIGECRDCQRPTDRYMVHHAVWFEAFKLDPHAKPRPAPPRGHLCFECLEKRLGRNLRLEDFQEHLPINRGIFFGAMLQHARVKDLLDAKNSA